MVKLQAIHDQVQKIIKETDYYSPYSTSNSVKELCNIIGDLLEILGNKNVDH